MEKQIYSPKNMGMHNTALVSRMGVDQPQGTYRRIGKEWQRFHASRQETFSLVAFESFCPTDETFGYTRQEEYIKINFWLSGRHTTILDSFGQHDHDRPEVFITSGPLDMTKVDVMNRSAHCVSLSLCLRRDFFQVHLGMVPEQLPEPLKSIVTPADLPYAFHRFTLTSGLVAAARGFLAAPTPLRLDPIYAQAKAIELICLLLNRMGDADPALPARAKSRVREESLLHEAREMICQRYAEPITLARISKEIGLNRMALTTGFKQLFGLSVYDYLLKERMEHAYQLLQDDGVSITRIGEAVGYEYPCNFSTAFRAYFGCTPQQVRRERA